MERRLQLLLDAARYGRVAGEAERSGRSVAAVIREAIDFRFPVPTDTLRIEAAAELLRVSASPEPGIGEDPSDLKEAYAEALADKVDRA